MQKPPGTKLSKKEKKKRKEERKANETKAAAAEPKSASASVDSLDVPEVDEASVGALSDEQRDEYAKSLKAAGNSAYGDKEYNRAIHLYTQAILCNPKEPVFYSNRAACHTALGAMDKVVEDCTAALGLKPEYPKALNRRAVAYEVQEMYQEALLDFTALCLIENFKKQDMAESVERLLNKVAQIKAKELMATRSVRLPSYSYVGNYLHSFRPKPRPAGLDDSAEIPEESGLGQLRLGLQSQEKKTREGYEDARVAFNRALELGDLGDHEALAHNMRGTYMCLLGNHKDATADFEASLALDPKMTDSYVKLATISGEQGNFSKAHDLFEQALEQNAQDPDIHYHSAQAHFIKGEYAEAARDYQKSIDLDRDFIYSHIQLGVSQYKTRVGGVGHGDLPPLHQKLPQDARRVQLLRRAAARPGQARRGD